GPADEHATERDHRRRPYVRCGRIGVRHARLPQQLAALRDQAVHPAEAVADEEAPLGCQRRGALHAQAGAGAGVVAPAHLPVALPEAVHLPVPGGDEHHAVSDRGCGGDRPGATALVRHDVEGPLDVDLRRVRGRQGRFVACGAGVALVVPVARPLVLQAREGDAVRVGAGPPADLQLDAAPGGAEAALAEPAQRYADRLSAGAGARRGRKQSRAGLLQRSEVPLAAGSRDRERDDVRRCASGNGRIAHAHADVEREAALAVHLAVEVAPRVAVETPNLLRCPGFAGHRERVIGRGGVELQPAILTGSSAPREDGQHRTRQKAHHDREQGRPHGETPTKSRRRQSTLLGVVRPDEGASGPEGGAICMRPSTTMAPRPGGSTFTLSSRSITSGTISARAATRRMIETRAGRSPGGAPRCPARSRAVRSCGSISSASPSVAGGARPATAPMSWTSAPSPQSTSAPNVGSVVMPTSASIPPATWRCKRTPSRRRPASASRLPRRSTAAASASGPSRSSSTPRSSLPGSKPGEIAFATSG